MLEAKKIVTQMQVAKYMASHRIDIEEMNRNKRFLKSFLKDQRKLLIENEKKNKTTSNELTMEKRDSLHTSIVDVSSAPLKRLKASANDNKKQSNRKHIEMSLQKITP